MSEINFEINAQNGKIDRRGRPRKNETSLNLKIDKEHIKEYNKEYYQLRKSSIEKVKCECGKSFMKTHQEKHINTPIHRLYLLEKL